VSGFIGLALVGALVFGALVLLRLPRLLWSFAGAALFLGAAGYAWQGRPGQAAAPAKPRVDAVPIEPEAIMLRERLMGRYTADTAYIVASDAMLRAGDKRAAAQVVLGGVRALPRSFILWTQLGSNLVMLDGDQISPAAKLAFGRAFQLAPEHPAPPYYAGIAYVRAGDLPAARRMLARAVSLSPEGMDYRTTIANQLKVLDQFIAATEQAGR
jgi:cytochrome c-type biogenesis protein CcmH/NrfG